MPDQVPITSRLFSLEVEEIQKELLLVEGLKLLEERIHTLTFVIKMRANNGILCRFQQQKSQDFLRVQSTALLNEHIVLLYLSVLKLIC